MKVNGKLKYVHILKKSLVNPACNFSMQKQNNDLNVFKKPQNKIELNTLTKIKKENVSQINSSEQIKLKEAKEEKPIYSKTKPQSPIFSSDEHDTEDDEDFMPKPFKIKQELDGSKSTNTSSIKQRFNIDCEDCEKVRLFIINIFFSNVNFMYVFYF